MEKQYIWQILIALDQLVNTIFGGWADETLSSRAYRLGKTSVAWRKLELVIDFLFRWKETYHCYKSYLNEQQRTQLPVELRSI